MTCIDTKEEVDTDSFFEALEDGEVYLVSREWTEEECEEVRRAIAENKAMQQETPAPEAVLA